MPSPAADAALAALTCWCATVTGAPPPPLDETAQRAAWLTAGRAAANGLPPVDLGAPLRSVFTRIQPRDGAPPAAYVRRAPLALDETLSPTADAAAGAMPAGALAESVAALDPHLPPEAHVEGLLFALQRFAWCLPSPLDGVSLYDYARTHAALAAALAADPQGDLFLLGGDLSGVQRFIYTLTAAGATKQLRGRSFYLQLLTEACARLLLARAEMPHTNLLYAGGGRFYALLPHQIDGMPAAAWVADQRAIFDRFLLRRHQGELYLALGGAPLPQPALSDADLFRDAWGAASEELARVKRRRFADLGAADLRSLFAPHGQGGGEDAACRVCGYQGDADDFVAPDAEGVRRCRMCHSFEDLGRLLHNAEHLLLHHLDRPATLDVTPGRVGWQALLAETGLHVQISGAHARPGARGNESPAWPARWTTALALSDGAPPAPPQQGPTVTGLRPVANTTPTMRQADVDEWKRDRERNREHDGERPPSEGDVMPFGVMVRQSRGIRRLGVLRMDVDDLGRLLARANTGLAATAGLSAALALFFEGRVGRICDETNAASARGKVYCIYSGGDDLFVVGSWHLLPGLARRISEELAAYTGGHPDVHLSAGLSLHPAKYPLYQAAEEAHAALEQAKARDGKAALSMLGQVVAWAYAGELFALQQRLAAAVAPGFTTTPDVGERETAARALLQIGQELYAQYRDTLRRGKLFYGPWLWRGAYQLRRIEQRLHEPDAKQLVTNLRETLLGGATHRPPNEGGRAIERLGLAARWAQLEQRKERRDGAGE